MENQTKHSLDQVLAAIERGHTKTGTARMLGCARNTVLAYARRWKSVADAFEDQKSCIVDEAQEGLLEAVKKREAWAITFALRTLGRDEGYVERQEHTGPDGGEIVFRVIRERVPDPPADGTP